MVRGHPPASGHEAMTTAATAIAITSVIGLLKKAGFAAAIKGELSENPVKERKRTVCSARIKRDLMCIQTST